MIIEQDLMNIGLVFIGNKRCGTNIELSDNFKTIIKETQSEDLVDETYNKIRELLEEMLMIIDKKEEQLMTENKLFKSTNEGVDKNEC